jgi:hypothetical protein
MQLIRRVQQGDEPGDAPRPSEYWIGLECYPADATLRAQLGLPNGGLVVEQVVPDSPGDKAGMKQHDVLVSVGDMPLTGVPALVEAIEAAKDEPIELEVLRGGKSMTIKVTPGKRPEQRRFPGRYLPEQDLGELRRWMETLRRGEAPRDGLRSRFFGPGAMLPPGGESQKLPKGLTITITRSGDEPAKITVKRGDESWEVTEEKLDELPEDIRPHVARMLGRPLAFLPRPDGPIVRGDRNAPPGPGRIERDMDRQMQEMNEQLERLRKQFEDLQRSLPRQPKKGDNERA